MKDVVYVGLQLLLFVIFLFENESWKFEVPQVVKILFMLLGILGGAVALIALFQLGGNLSPFPSPKRKGKLITTGLFHYMRHPIYTGIIFSAFSISTFFGSGLKLTISFLLVVLFFLKSKYEEKRLLEKFPDYREYCQDTGRFLPKI